MRKYSKLLAVLSITVAMIFVMTSCGEKPAEKAEKAVTKAFTALQSGDIEGAGKYVDVDDLTKYTDMDLSEDDIQKEQLMTIIKAFFSNLNYEILTSEEQKDGSVLVEARISNVDGKEVADKWTKEIMAIGLRYCDLDDAAIEEMAGSLELSDITFFHPPKKAIGEMVDSAERCVKQAAEEDKFEEHTVTLKVKETDDGWKLNLSNGQRDIIFGSFTKAMHDIA